MWYTFTETTGNENRQQSRLWRLLPPFVGVRACVHCTLSQNKKQSKAVQALKNHFIDPGLADQKIKLMKCGFVDLLLCK